jgi:trimeric autotransporter adhesin
MKQHARILSILLALPALSTFNSWLSTVHAQGTAFTYQGQLQNNGSLASGTYNLTFSLYATNTGGSAVAGPVTNSAVAISNGLFTVTIDFGSSVWNGQTNWLQIGAETNNAISFNPLAPRQQLTPVPYAIAAESTVGAIPASQLTSIGNTNGGSANFFTGTSGNGTTSGSDNTANGFKALSSDTSGSRNTANGADALLNNLNGIDNTADGVSALFENQSGSLNIALGYQAGFNISTGSSNIDIGNTGLSTDAQIIRIGNGQAQTYIAGVINGNGGGLTNLSASQLTSIGNSNGGSANFFVGSSGNGTTSGGGNTGYGSGALFANTSGANNTANGAFALDDNTIGAGNTADGAFALVLNSSGSFNTASGNQALDNNGSGSDNTAVGFSALEDNTSGSNNISLGYGAGFYITTGSSNIDIGNMGLSTDTNIIRIGSGQTATYLVGNVYTPSGTVQSSSDRNVKEDFATINPKQILAKVASLPVTEWNYKTGKGVEHIGPMAQDFHAAFGLNGADDKHISVVDEGGVALAAVQGLNLKLEEQAKEKDAEIADLKTRLDALEKIVLKQKSN